MSDYYVVVLVRGTRNLRYKIKHTLFQLKLTRRYHAALLPQTETSLGMLKSVAHAAAFGIASDAVVKKLQAKGQSPYRMHPPRKRFGTIKQTFPRGMLGNWKESINELVESML